MVQSANELTVSTLILQDVRDHSVPSTLTETLRDQRPDLVALKSFEAVDTAAVELGSGQVAPCR